MQISPTTVEAVQAAVQTHDRLIPRGGGSKPALLAQADGNGKETAILDLSGLSGITEYDPGEYTFTARAGTPVKEVAAALAENGQYLPFDPLFLDEGATLGGTVAANTAGPGRYRYGGVRDFLIGVRFVDGQGNLVRGGGRVVKNASGFDLPKFFVGSLGRYGILVETSFKVFPQPRSFLTVSAAFSSLAALQAASIALATAPLEMDAQEWVPRPEGGWTLVIRLGGLPHALPPRVERLQTFLETHGQAAEFEVLAGDDDAALWAAVNRCAWLPDGAALVKVPLAPRQVPLVETETGTAGRAPLAARRYSAAGNIGWLAMAEGQIPLLAAVLHDLDLAGLVLRGAAPAEPLIGRRRGLPLAARVKQALDPGRKFGGN